MSFHRGDISKTKKTKSHLTQKPAEKGQERGVVLLIKKKKMVTMGIQFLHNVIGQLCKRRNLKSSL
jgi:hypothetical protein